MTGVAVCPGAGAATVAAASSARICLFIFELLLRLDSKQRWIASGLERSLRCIRIEVPHGPPLIRNSHVRKYLPTHSFRAICAACAGGCSRYPRAAWLPAALPPYPDGG